jgi:hypothetical protein
MRYNHYVIYAIKKSGNWLLYGILKEVLFSEETVVLT